MSAFPVSTKTDRRATTRTDSTHRCQALTTRGTRCRNQGEPSAIHPARLCRAHQQAARDDSLRLTKEGHETVAERRAEMAERERLTARWYYVGADRVDRDGRLIRYCPVSASYTTYAQAQKAQKKLRNRYPDALVIK